MAVDASRGRKTKQEKDLSWFEGPQMLTQMITVDHHPKSGHLRGKLLII